MSTLSELNDCLGSKYNYWGRGDCLVPTALEFIRCYDEAAVSTPLRISILSDLCRCTMHILLPPSCRRYCGCNKLVTRQTHKAGNEYLNVWRRRSFSRVLHACSPAVSRECAGRRYADLPG